MKASMSSHNLLNVFDLYCIFCSQFILENATVHTAASVNIKDETWNSVYDRPHDALEDDIDITIGVMLTIQSFMFRIIIHDSLLPST